LLQFAQCLAKIGLAQLRSALQDAQRPSHLQVKRFCYLPSLGLVDQHCTYTQLKRPISRFISAGLATEATVRTSSHAGR